MNFDEVINKRQSIRNYDDKEVTYEELKTLINAARLAPSAKNRQPWRFYILTDEEKDNIASMMYEWDKLNRNEKTSVKGTANQMKEANKVIMVYYPLYKSKQKNTYYKKPDYLSLGASIENLILKCTEINLGCCWCCDTLYLEEEIDTYLGIKGYEQISAILIGHPKHLPMKKEKLSLDELILNKDIFGGNNE